MASTVQPRMMFMWKCDRCPAGGPMVYDPDEAARQGAIHDAKHAMDDAREGHTEEKHAA